MAQGTTRLFRAVLVVFAPDITRGAAMARVRGLRNADPLSDSDDDLEFDDDVRSRNRRPAERIGDGNGWVSGGGGGGGGATSDAAESKTSPEVEDPAERLQAFEELEDGCVGGSTLLLPHTHGPTINRLRFWRVAQWHGTAPGPSRACVHHVLPAA